MKNFLYKKMSRVLLFSIIPLLLFSYNNAFWINVINSNTYENDCTWADVFSDIYIAWSSTNIYPVDNMRSHVLSFVRNTESEVHIWENSSWILSSWCYNQNNWWRLSNVVPSTYQWVWIIKNFWNDCTVSKVMKTNKSLPSVQFVYKVAYKEEIWFLAWTSSYFYYPSNYNSSTNTWGLSSTPSYLSNQTKRKWWPIKIHANECHKFNFRWCWDGVLDSSDWEMCDPNDPSKTWWGSWGCNPVCRPVEAPTCDNLIVNPNSWEVPLNSDVVCSWTNADYYNIDCWNWTTLNWQ